jgi:hypothetical protein
MHTLISMLGLHYFDLREFLRMAPRCQNMYDISKKVKQSRYRPGVAQRVPGS